MGIFLQQTEESMVLYTFRCVLTCESIQHCTLPVQLSKLNFLSAPFWNQPFWFWESFSQIKLPAPQF